MQFVATFLDLLAKILDLPYFPLALPQHLVKGSSFLDINLFHKLVSSNLILPFCFFLQYKAALFLLLMLYFEEGMVHVEIGCCLIGLLLDVLHYFA